jgi:uncharacterized protein YbjT (DUF2867 family)
MIVLVAGAHGVTGKQVVALLAKGGHRVKAMVRDLAQAPELEALGAEPVLGDLEGEVGRTVEGVTAIVFAAGAGAGSGVERKETVDYGGAVKLIDAALAHGVRRYVMLSALGIEDPAQYLSTSESMRAYAAAKLKADKRLQESGLDYTIVRPGLLNNEPGTGKIEAAPFLDRQAKIPRADVAECLVAALELDGTIGKTFEILSGQTPIREALEAL